MSFFPPRFDKRFRPALLLLPLCAAGVAALSPAQAVWAQANFASLEQLDAAVFGSFDRDNNGSLTKAEVGAYPWGRYDADKNGEVSRAEFDNGRAADRRRAEATNDHAEALRLLDWNLDDALDGRETDNGKWLKYDADGDGTVTKDEFTAGRTKEKGASRPAAARPAAAPSPARVATTPAPAPERPVRLPPLAPRRGHVIGRAVFADGRAVPSFTVSALGFYGKLHLGPSGTLPFLGEHKKASGRYAIQTRDYAYTKEPVDALVSSVTGLAHIQYRGKEYALRLHPLDGKIDGSDPKAYRGQSGPGAVRDFVLKMSGVRPAYAAYNTPHTSVEDNGTMMNTFYGATLNVSLAAYDPGTTDLSKSHPPGSVVTLTLTPLGPLMDGSAGAVVTRTYRFAEKALNWEFVTRDIPLGAYTATATLTEPGGTSYPLRIKQRSAGTDYAASQAIEFPPYALYLGGVERVNLTLTR